MPARQGPGRPPESGRPRKIVDEYARIAQGFVTPTTYAQTLRMLRGGWSEYLRSACVDSDDVDVMTFHRYLQGLRAKGFTHNRQQNFLKVREAHVLVWRSPDYAGTAWPQIADQVESIPIPNAEGEKEPFQPYPLKLIPRILDASRLVKQFRVGSGEDAYSEAFAVVATLLYSGGRAQFYGLRTEQVVDALGTKILETRVKGGHLVKLPVHDRLIEIWKQHLDRRDYPNSPFLFRRGKDPYSYKSGEKDYLKVDRNAHSNNMSVQEILNWESQRDRDSDKDCVRRRLRELAVVDEDLTAHRFRKSVGTHYDSYGLKEDGPEMRLVLSHGAKTITAQYNVKDILEVQAKISRIDLGSAEWIAAHDPPSDLFDENARRVEELRGQLAAADERAKKAEDRADRMERKLDEVLARIEPRVIA